jgi:oxidase EvaA
MSRPAQVQQIARMDCAEWETGADRIRHRTGRYFSVACIRSATTERIMIDQPEVGILGFLYVGEAGERCWLVQNKPEPGNVGCYQYAPTVQATRSNYERIHGGKETAYLAYFVERDRLLVDVEGSEQGGKFLNKFNRNCKRALSEKPEVCNPHSFLWLDNATFRRQLRQASGYWSLLSDSPERCFADTQELESDLCQALQASYGQSRAELTAQAKGLLRLVDQQDELRVVPFAEMEGFSLTAAGIDDAGGVPAIRYFDVHFPERETPHWQQPLMLQACTERCVLFVAVIHEVAYFYLSAFPELGLVGHAEFGPSLQTGVGPGKCTEEQVLEWLSQAQLLAEIDQSDEGGRFYASITRYTLARWPHALGRLTQANGLWVTGRELEDLSLQRGMLTNELRTMISLLLAFI